MIPARTFIAIAAVLWSACAALAQPRAEAQLDRSRAYIGDEILYEIRVSEADPAAQPSVEFPPQVRATYAGQSQEMYATSEMVGGRLRQVTQTTWVFRYRLAPIEPGTIDIPPASITLQDGTSLTTQPARLVALLPQFAEGFDIEVRLPRPTLYLGETTAAEIVWTLPETIILRTFDSSVIPSSLEINPANPQTTPGTELTQFEFLGRRMYGVVEQGPAGRQFRFRLLLTPTATGRVTLGPIRVTFDRMDSRNTKFQAYSESDPIAIEVIPLPTENRPADFSGLIGTFNLTAEASPTIVNVGDPITLRVELTGDEPMVGADTLPGPARMLGSPNTPDAFRTSADAWREEEPRTAGRRAFTTTLRALHPEVTEIPALTLHAFDPAEGAYRVVQSQPIPLEVRAVRETTIADARSAGGSLDPRPQAQRPTLNPAEPAFWAAPTADQITAARPLRLFRPTLTNPVAATIAASGPASILAATLLLVRRRRQSDPAHQTLRALRHAERLAARGDSPAAARAAVAAALACEPAAVTAADVARVPADADTLAPIRAWLAHAERSGPTPDPLPASTVRRLRHAVARSLREARQ